MRSSPDALTIVRAGVLHRLIHHEGQPVLVRVAQTAADRVIFGACARTRQSALYGIDRMRFALGIDVDVRSFHRLFCRDAVIGESVRRRPWLRTARQPHPFTALAWAVCEQLIEYQRAAAIERRIVRRLGRRLTMPDRTVLCDAPSAAALAQVSPALLQSLDLGAQRARALIACAREVAAGRIDLHGAEHQRAWGRLRIIPGIGPWTVQMLALHGQGREDQVPAGDVGLLRRVGVVLSGGDPRAFATEEQVLAFFAPYGEWAGLAASHVLSASGLIRQAQLGRPSQPAAVEQMQPRPKPGD